MEVSKCSSRSCERATATWLLGGINYRLNFLGCKIATEESSDLVCGVHRIREEMCILDRLELNDELVR